MSDKIAYSADASRDGDVFYCRPMAGGPFGWRVVAAVYEGKKLVDVALRIGMQQYSVRHPARDGRGEMAATIRVARAQLRDWARRAA